MVINSVVYDILISPIDKKAHYLYGELNNYLKYQLSNNQYNLYISKNIHLKKYENITFIDSTYNVQ